MHREVARKGTQQTPQTYLSNDNKKEQQQKVVSRDLKVVINSGLLQDVFTVNSLILPHMFACMVRFVQTQKDHIYTVVFETS